MFTVLWKEKDRLITEFGDHNQLEVVIVKNTIDPFTFHQTDSLYYRMTVNGSILPNRH
jgi:hypothetical protein